MNKNDYKSLSNVDRRVSAVLRNLEKVQIESLLELGSRNGEILDILSSKITNIKRICAVDISEKSVKICANKGYEAIQLDLETSGLPFENNSFDCVLALEVLEHIAKFHNPVSEAKRVLKPDGVFIITVPNIARLRKRVGMLIGKDPHRIYDPHEDGVHIREFTSDSLKKLFNYHDLIVRKIEYIAFPGRNPIAQFLKKFFPPLRTHILCVVTHR